MIHQVTQSEQNTQMLRQIIDLQLKLLTLAANESSEDGILRNLETSLRTLYAEAEQAKEVVQWITRRKRASKYNVVFSSLLGFAAHPDLQAKQTFIDDVTHDVNLIYNPQQARLRVAISNDSPNWQKAARYCLLEFYEVLGTASGFPAFLFQPRAEQTKFRRWDFIDNFTNANPDLRLCAVCDSTLYRTTIGSRPYTSIEHFFPKSRYPHLAVHPFNLIPICPYCNSGAAGATDPFGVDNLGVLGLILPYQTGKQSRGLSEQTYVFVNPRHDREKHPFHLEILPTKHYPDAEALIANFERIYKVQERWNLEIDWIDQHVFRRITQFLMADVQSGNRLEDAAFLVDRLGILMAIVSKENLGRDPFGHATVWLLKHHIDSLQTSTKNMNEVPIYATLQEWAYTQQKRWQEYRDHAQELKERVP